MIFLDVRLSLMKEHSELFTIFQTICNEIQTQFRHSISVLHSDNAIFLRYGILWYGSSIHLPPYPLTEWCCRKKKQCHIIEKACTLSIHAIAPTNFEGDDILGDGYLINRMSLSSINDEVPRLFYFLMKFSLRFLLVFFILLVLYMILLQVLIS